jgi:hypothetical protein
VQVTFFLSIISCSIGVAHFDNPNKICTIYINVLGIEPSLFGKREKEKGEKKKKKKKSKISTCL